MVAPSVFISYSHADAEVARSLAAACGRSGMSVWIDEGELRAGDSVLDAIAEQIGAVDFLVAVVSEHSVASNWCRYELSLAMTRSVGAPEAMKVLPVRVGQVAMPASLPHLLYRSFDPGTPERLGNQLVEDVWSHFLDRPDAVSAYRNERLGFSIVGGARRPLQVSGHRPHCDRAGNRVVAIATGGDIVLSEDGGATARVLLEMERVDCMAVKLSPDGRSLAFNQRDRSRPHESSLVVVDVETREILWEAAACRSRYFHGLDSSFDWSPDSCYVAWLQPRHVPDPRESLHVVEVASGMMIEVENPTPYSLPLISVHWSPGDNVLAYVAGGGGKAQVILYSLASKAITPLTGFRGLAGVRWLDESQLVLVGGGAGAYHLAVLDRGGRSKTIISSDGAVHAHTCVRGRIVLTQVLEWNRDKGPGRCALKTFDPATARSTELSELRWDSAPEDNEWGVIPCGDGALVSMRGALVCVPVPAR